MTLWMLSTQRLEAATLRSCRLTDAAGTCVADVSAECVGLQETRGAADETFAAVLGVRIPKLDFGGFVYVQLEQSDDEEDAASAPLLMLRDASLTAAVNAALHLSSHATSHVPEDDYQSDSEESTAGAGSTQVTGSELRNAVLQLLGKAILGEDKAECVRDALQLVCNLRGECPSGALEPLMMYLFRRLPTLDRAAAAELLVSAVLSENVGRVRHVLSLVDLHHIDANDLGLVKVNLKDMKCFGVDDGYKPIFRTLVDSIAPRKRLMSLSRTSSSTALHAAASIATGDIAMVLLCTPGIASPSSWYQIRGCIGMTPSEVAEASLQRWGYDSENLLIGGGVIGDFCGRGDIDIARTPGMIVPEMMGYAARVAEYAFRDAKLSLRMAPGCDVEEELLGHQKVIETVLLGRMDESPVDEDWNASDDDDTRWLVGALADSIIRDTECACFLLDDNVSLMSVDAPVIGERERRLRELMCTEHESHAESSGEVERGNMTIGRCKQGETLGARTRWLACLIPDGNVSIFAEAQDENALLREQHIREEFGKRRGVSAMDLRTMVFVWFIMLFMTLKVFEWNFATLAEMFMSSMSSSIHLLSFFMPTIIFAYSSFLMCGDGNKWIRRRESMLMLFCLSCPMYAFVARQFIFMKGLCDDDEVMKVSYFRHMLMPIMQCVAPIRLERHLALYFVMTVIMVTNAAHHMKSIDYSRVAIDVLVAVAIWIPTSLFMLRTEREQRGKMKWKW